MLLGGVPLRLVRLGPRAAAHVAGWIAGEPVADRPRARALARRLLDAGLVHPVPPAVVPGEVTVVVPAHGRPQELDRCLAALGRAHPVVVVDDGSPEPAPVARAAARAGATLVRRHENGGPAAARNAGLAAATTPFVAFVDSDCVPATGWVEALLAHLADPAVALAAPRIVGAGSPGRRGLAAFEHARSALDLGPDEARVRPGSGVPYVPAAALVARRDALGVGFDPALRVGEDVDLAWRLARAGWTIRYDPSVRVAHVHRVRLSAWLATRIAYNEAAAPLALRHPGALRAAYASRWSTAAWGLAAAGRPGAGLAIAAGSALLLRRRLAPFVPGAGPVAARIAGRGLLRDGLDLARALRGAWLPGAVLAGALSRRGRRVAAATLLAAPMLEWVQGDRAIGPATDVAGTVLADAARGIGVWRGCIRHRTPAPLLPGLGVDRAARDPVGRQGA